MVSHQPNYEQATLELTAGDLSRTSCWRSKPSDLEQGWTF